MGKKIEIEKSKNKNVVPQAQRKFQLNFLSHNVLYAFPPLLLGLTFMSSVEAQTILNEGQDIHANGLNSSLYNLQLGGNVSWNTEFLVNSAARSNITIDGNGKTITSSSNYTQRLLNLSQNNSNITITNATITSQPFTFGRSAMIYLGASTITANLNLNGTTFSNIGPTNNATAVAGDYGPIISVRGGTGSVLNINGGTAGVTFRGNNGVWDQPGVIGVYAQNKVNFTGKVTFDSNRTGNYGGAVTVFEAGTAANPTTMTFGGETLFTNNHSSVFGGAVDMWGGPALLSFSGPTTFSGNYVYGTTTTSNDYPTHVTDQHSRGGAINIGYVSPGTGNTTVTFNNAVTFNNNYVIDVKAAGNRNALGGAVSAYGNGANLNYFMNFNGATTFNGNYVYSLSGSGYGGAIYYDAGTAATLNLGAGSTLTNNYAKTLGGAIYLQTGTINLNATGGDITFQGNRHGATFNPVTGGFYTPVTGSGTPNAIYLAGTGSLNLATGAGNFIHFYDPIASAAGVAVTVNKTGAGEVVFHGNTVTPGDVNYNSNINTNTNVNGGLFTLSDAVIYGNTTSGVFAVNNAGAVRGNNNSTLRAQTININSGGTLAANGGIFNLNAGTGGVVSTAGRFGGYGTIVAPTISLSNTASNITVADIASGNTLTVNAILSNAGGLSKINDGTLVLAKANTYTGATSITTGKLQAGIANVIATSNNLSMTGGIFDLNNFNQTVNNLSGTGGSITTGTGNLTVNSTSATAFSGVISGAGQLIKQGTNTLTLNGINTYSGGTNITTGTLIATNGNALGTGLVNNAAGLQLTFASDSTLSNQLSGTGGLVKLGTGTATLIGSGSSQGNVNVLVGALQFNQNGVFNAASLITNNSATTILGANAKLVLSGALTQNASSTLNVALGTVEPIISANSATLGGTLTVSNIDTSIISSQASALATNDTTIIHTTGGITGNFSSVNLSGTASLVDYLTLAGRISGNDYNVGFGLRWLAGTALGNGTFTLTNASDTFNVDVALNNQTGTFTSGWNGQALTKAGAGTLVLSAANGYTGSTLINAGTLRTGINNAFLNSANVTVASGATLNLNGFAQQANNLNGAGNITLGSSTGILTANNSSNTTFSGLISGSGRLIKTGASTLTLSGTNTYTGGSSINAGTLIATNGGVLGTGAVSNAGALQLNFAGDSTLTNQLSGVGSLTKTGTGTAHLTGTGSSQGAVNVSTGTLQFDQNGIFNAASYGTATGATTTLAANATLGISGALTQSTGSILNVAVGTVEPVISANTAALGGTLNITGFNATAPTSASALANTEFTVLHTTNGITGNFSSVNLGGAASLVDYLTLAGRVSGNDYNVGFGLTWLAGTALGNGTFTLTNASDTFNVDVALNNQTGTFTSGWNGQALTKAGAGTLVLSAANGYTGNTLINAGTLQTGINNAFSNSANVTVASGATLNLNGFAQQVNNLTGAGNITLGSSTGILTANNSSNTTFSGLISGSGRLIKTGASTLTLSGANTYAGGSSINTGTLIATNGSALGTGTISNAAALQLNFAGNSTLSNQLSGIGSLTKTGTGAAHLTGTGSSQGAVNVSTGTLQFDQNGIFNAASYGTATGATTTLAANATLGISGALTQSTGSTLNVAVGTAEPVISANTAALGGTLNITGFNATAPTSASALANTEFTVLHTTNGITGNFSSVNLGGAASLVDYLTLAGRVSGNDYNVGFGLTWLAGTALGNGTFTLTNASDTFNVDVALNNQTGSFTSGWNGQSLTKAGAGTLILSAANGYTGNTLINAGTLQTGINNAFLNSANVTVASGATLNLNGFSQQVNNLTGSGSINLGSGVLTANNTTGTAYSGVISGTGQLHTLGASALTLSGINTYSGGSSIVASSLLIATNGSALGTGGINNAGTLLLNFAGDSTLNNQLSGTGSLTKTGTGIASLTGVGSSQGNISVNSGTLQFNQNGVFNAIHYSTANGATTTLAANATLSLSGLLTQNTGSTLNVAVGTAEPAISANTAALDGALNITGFNATAPTSASALANTEFTVLHTTNGITGNFSSVNLGGASSLVDYLTLAGRISGNDYNVGFGLTWLAGTALGNGTFTLTNASDSFTMDVALSDQTGSFTSGWDGKSLTKAGAGTLILSAANGYTGDTVINGGTLQAGINNAFSNSANITVGTGATLDLNGFAQQANNLSGSGSISLSGVSGILTAHNSSNSAFSGVISGDGGLIKTGTGTLTLSGANTYTGNSSINAGTVIATNGSALGAGNIANDAILELGFNSDSELSNQLSGTGSLNKTGTGTATLSGAGSSQGNVTVNTGTLAFTQTGDFSAENYSTASGATTTLAADATLALTGTLTQSTGSILNVAIGATEPVISAETATLGGTLNITGFTTTAPTNASDLTNTEFTVVHTNTGITGDFSNVTLGGASSLVDYLTLAGRISGNDYNVGFGLTWLAGAALGNGTFTLTNASDSFTMDVALSDQTGSFTSGWDGKSLTKAGAGTLILSAANGYTGDTVINGGTLQAGINNAFSNSANITVGTGATLDLNGFAQQANNLSGSGSISLSGVSGILTAHNSSNSAFSGVISGDGGLIKTGTGTLTLSGANTYTGNSSINAGTVIATNGSALGAGNIANDAILELGFNSDSELSNQLSGTGSLNKTGTGTATLSGAGSSQGNVTVNTGTLAFTQTGDFSAENYSTASGATTTLAADATLALTGTLTQSTGSILNVAIGATEPVISAETATLGGTLNITGFTTTAPTNASDLTNTEFTVVHTNTGITGDFSNVTLGGASSLVDYLTLAGRISGNDYNVGFGLTWLAGAALGNGTFTLTNASDSFTMDVALSDQTGSFTSGWDGKSLTKAGAGTLILSAANGYTGDTVINGGTLQAGINNAFSNSANITVGTGATLDLNGFAQQANNLSGSGSISLSGVSGILTAHNSSNSAFSGVISGDGGLIKTGTGTLTLSGANTYTGNSSINAGTVIATNGSALGAGNIANDAILELGFNSDSELSNQLSGTGSLNKTGTGTATLSGAGSSQGNVTVNTGTLAFTQTGDFSAENYSTASGATTTLAADATLALTGTLTQSTGSILNVAIGATEPVISAETATLGGTLNITGFTTTAPTNASDLTNTEFTVVHTNTGITGDFSNVTLGGASSLVDYLTLAGRISGNDYNVGFGLTWLAGAALGNGTFTLTNASDSFTMDVALSDQTGSFTSGWDGKSLTKAGAGTLILSAANGYTGDTVINGGTLQAGINNAFSNSANVTVGTGATLDLNGFAQQANNLSGSGSISLGGVSGILTAHNSSNSAFSGVISGDGGLIKTGTGTLTLSGANTYTGNSSINAGTVIATNGSALGAGNISNDAILELGFNSDSELSNQLSGTGSLNKTGTGTATLSGAGSSQGNVTVNTGTLAFTQTGDFSAENYSTASGATTTLAADATLALTGTLTQSTGSILNVAIGATEPVISAETATLGGTLNITGFTTTAPTNASDLTNTEFTVVHTNTGITGDFSNVTLGGASSLVDYLTLAGRISGNDYNVGFGLTWLAGAALGNGTFTLTNASDSFTMDVALSDQTGSFTSGWDGKSLTKAGAGTLILSAANGYTGDTVINGGTLQAGINNAFSNSANITVGTGATLDLNGFAQQANNLSGSGSISLSGVSGILTAHNSSNSAFSGVISGDGGLIKTGTGTLTLSGANTYTGNSSINAGTVIATNGSALGAGNIANDAILELGFNSDSELSNQLSGTGSLNKTGTGTATLSGAGSSQGNVTVNTGTLAFTQTGDFSAENYSTASGATTTLAADATLALTGTLTQSTGSILNVAIGATEPVISAETATLGGTLNITGFTTTAPTNASDLTNTEFTVVHTNTGITGDFSNVTLGGASSLVDYLTLAGRISGNDYNVGFGLTWLAGAALGNGTFTLTNASDSFTMDVALSDQTGSFTSGWDGKSLTKAGAGTLILSAANGYTGDTVINGGTLQAGINNAFSNSANVTVGTGATLDLNGFAQQANNLSGSGSISLGGVSGILTAHNSSNSAFSGVISGDGGLIKTGTGTLTLSGANTYTGNSSINAGTVIATNGSALGAGNISNDAILELGFNSDSELSNQLSGTGSLNKTGTGTATLSGAGSSQGNVTVNTGTLAFTQTGDFSAENYSTASGATTTLAADATLALTGTLTQSTGSILNVAIGATEPVISAETATLGGTLNITGFTTTAPTNASDLTNTEFTVVHTNTGITGDFSNVTLGGASSLVDYLTLAGRISGNDYNVGFGLTWLAGAALGNGTFTLTNASDSFTMDVALSDQTGSFTSGWDGKSLTKAGAGTLILSAANGYTGDTVINGGTLQAGINNAFSNSANVTVGTGATLDLNGFAQQANNLSGSGSISLGGVSGILTAHNSSNSAFSGVISGDGGLIKTGTGTLTLSGANTYTGNSSINAGTVIATNGSALGAGNISNDAILELGFNSDSELSNQLSGTGSLNKTGTGTATLSGAGSSQGNVTINTGTLAFTQTGDFSAENYSTASGATTTLGSNASLAVNHQFTVDGTLNVTVGNTQPVITADMASIGSNASFNLAGFSASASATASELANGHFVLMRTSAPGNLTGSFTNINLGGAVSTVDYLSMTTINTGQEYDVGLSLSWYGAYTTDPQDAHGTFTLAGANEMFDLDAVLADETPNGTNGWDGKSLTKTGAGTLILSKANTYTGSTLIDGGTLRAGTNDIFTDSEQVTVSAGATFDLDNFDQHVNNLSGAGNILLGSAALTTNNTIDAVFSGVISGSGSLNKVGTGTLLLTADDTYTGATTISEGTLQLGNGGATGSVVGNIDNDGLLIINRSADYHYDGVISGSGDFTHQGTGYTFLSNNQTYTGATAVNSGALVLLNNSQLSSTAPVTVAQNAILGGYGGVSGDVTNNGLIAVADAVPGFANNPTGDFLIGGNLVNNGEIRMASLVPASTLTVNGNYVGNNGLLTISTKLAGDGSATDKLIINGDTSGTTRVVVNNAGGSGAQTNNGIEIIKVTGQSDGQFSLANAVVAGAYEYSLYQGTPSLSDGNWYLRSVGQDAPHQWRPESGIYLGNQSLAGLMQMHTLYDRQSESLAENNGGAWLRVVGGKTESKAAGGQVDIDSDYTLMHFGSDLVVFEDGKQQVQVGLMGSIGHGSTDASANKNLNGERKTADGSIDGYNLGLYATWIADAKEQKGAYVDGWLQHGWYDNDVSREGMSSNNYDARLLTASVEAGYSFALNSENSAQHWRLTPQAQIAYSKYTADRFVDSSGTTIDGQNNDQWITRIGARLSGQIQKNSYVIQPFSEINWWHNGKNNSVSFDNMSVGDDTKKDRAELKLGVQVEFNPNWNAWLNVGMQSDFSDYKRLEGVAGVRYTW